MVCYEKLIFKEIDDLIIDSLGIVAFISFFVGGCSNSNCTKPMNPLIPVQTIRPKFQNFISV
jgi:phospholipid/cholesterol/gamma-HCH transport system permease protein